MVFGAKVSEVLQHLPTGRDAIGGDFIASLNDISNSKLSIINAKCTYWNLRGTTMNSDPVERSRLTQLLHIAQINFRPDKSGFVNRD